VGMLLPDVNLQRDVSLWKSNKGDNINDPASISFEASQVPDGSMIVTNKGDQPFAGALVSNTIMKVPVNSSGNQLQYVAMRFRYIYNGATYENLARHELDLKVCYLTRPPKPPGSDTNPQIRNVANFSTQWNKDTGQFQLDLDPPKWVDSGYIVKDILPDTWHTMDYRLFFDPNVQTFSILWWQLDQNPRYEIPSDLQNVPMTLTNWEECRKIQIQNEMYQPGETVIQYGQVGLVWSDEPIEEVHWPY
jgi:hypothetical protein